MATPTISSFPSRVYTGEEIQIVGTNFEDSTGTDPITDITIDTSPAIDVVYWRVISSTIVAIGIPTVPNGTVETITITNGSGSVSTSENITFSLRNISKATTKIAAAVDVWTTERLLNVTKGNTKLSPAIDTWTTERLLNVSKLITKLSAAVDVWTTERLLNITKGITKLAPSIDTWTTIAEFPVYVWDLDFVLSNDCKSLTIKDITDHTAIGVTRSSISLQLKATDIFSGKTLTVTGNTSDLTKVNEWSIVLSEDTVIEFRLFAGASNYLVESLLVNCGGNKCVLRANQKYIDEYLSNPDKTSIDKLIELTALNNVLIANFKIKQFAKVKRRIDEFKEICRC